MAEEDVEPRNELWHDLLQLTYFVTDSGLLTLQGNTNKISFGTYFLTSNFLAALPELNIWFYFPFLCQLYAY